MFFEKQKRKMKDRKMNFKKKANEAEKKEQGRTAMG